MNETKPITLADLQGTVRMLDVILGPFRQRLARTMTPEKFAALEADPEADPPYEDPGESANYDIDLSDEAVELMAREEPVLDEDRLRDEEREMKS